MKKIFIIAASALLLAACGGNKNEKASGENADSCAQALTAELDQALAGEQPDGKEVEELVKRGQDAVQELMAKGDSAAARAYADRLNIGMKVISVFEAKTVAQFKNIFFKYSLRFR